MGTDELAYLDSNVLISSLLEERSRYRNLCIEANAFFYYAAKNKVKIIVSELFIKEIRGKLRLPKEAILSHLGSLNIKFELAGLLKEDLFTAKRICRLGIHFSDSLHIAIALRAKCSYIVTFNAKDFSKASGIIQIREPADFT